MTPPSARRSISPYHVHVKFRDYLPGLARHVYRQFPDLAAADAYYEQNKAICDVILMYCDDTLIKSHRAAADP